MFRAVLELLVLRVPERGWNDGSASCAATMDEKEPDHPIRHYIEGLRKSHVEGLIPDADTLVLGKALGDGPEARKYAAAVERLIHETLDEIEQDPATEAFERMVNLQIAPPQEGHQRPSHEEAGDDEETEPQGNQEAHGFFDGALNSRAGAVRRGEWPAGSPDVPRASARPSNIICNAAPEIAYQL